MSNPVLSIPSLKTLGNIVSGPGDEPDVFFYFTANVNSA